MPIWALVIPSQIRLLNHFLAHHFQGIVEWFSRARREVPAFPGGTLPGAALWPFLSALGSLRPYLVPWAPPHRLMPLPRTWLSDGTDHCLGSQPTTCSSGRMFGHLVPLSHS